MSTRGGRLLSRGTTPEEKMAHYRHSPEQDLVQTIMTNLCKGTYYASQDELIKQSVDIHKIAVDRFPQFHLKALQYGRDKGNMYLQILIGLAAGSKVYTNEQMLPLLNTMTPKRVLEYLEILKSKTFGHGLGRQQKELVIAYLANKENLGYYTVKYKDEIRDILRIVHPTREDVGEEKFTTLGYTIDGVPKAQEQIDLKALQTVNDNDELFFDYLMKANLPWDVTTTLNGSPLAWRARAARMPAGALLGNLATLERHNALDVDYVSSRLTREAIRRARLFPQNIIKAWNKAPDTMKSHLRDLLIESFTLKDEYFADTKTMVVMDVSGSMTSHVDTILDALAMSITVLISSKDFDMYYFDTELYHDGDIVLRGGSRHPSLWDSGTQYYREYPRIVGMSPTEIVDSMLNVKQWLHGGGTDWSLPLRYILDHDIHYDLVMMISDEQQNEGSPAYELWEKYVKDHRSRMVILNVQPYRGRVIPSGALSAICLPSRNPVVLEVIKFMGVDLVDFISAS